jgi:curved DNA-binding protein CbpA/ribosomal protein L21E
MTASREDLSSDCYYKNLGISKTASDQEIKAAYRKLALKYHPDKNKDNADSASEKFKKVSEAYDCLSDKEKREIFDAYGKRGLESGGCGGGNGFGRGHFINPDDIFRQFFASNGGFNDDFSGFGGGGFSFNMGGDDFGGHGGFRGHHPGMRQRKPAAPRYPSGPHVIPKGTSVTMHSLVGAPQYNGMQGELVFYDSEKERYRVSFGDEESAISVKSSNFVQMVNNVRLREINSRPQLNGCQGQVTGVNGERYHVKLAGAESVVVSVTLANLILPADVRVHIHSLNGAPQYNGKTGRVVEFLEEDNRYLIEIAGNKQLKLKMDNLMI